MGHIMTLAIPNHSSLESLHLSRMHVYKFIKLNISGNIIDVLPNDIQYAKLIIIYSIDCDEAFCSITKLRFLNKKR